MRRDLSMPPESAGFWFGLAVASGAVGVLLMGYLFDRIGGKRATIIGGSTSAALTFLFFIQRTGSAATLAILVLALLVSTTFWSMLSALTQLSVDQGQLGTATGLVQSIGFVGAVIGPSIVGSLAKGGDISSPLIWTVSLPYFLYALLMLFYKQKRSSIRTFDDSLNSTKS